MGGTDVTTAGRREAALPIDPRTDAELVSRWLAGDHHAFAAIYDRYADAIYAFALARVRNQADAADVVHDTFVRAADRLAQLPTVAAVRGEGTVWGIEFAAVGDLSAEAVAQEVVRRCYLGDDKGRAIHLLGPLAGKVVRIAPPLTMDLDEAREYFATLHALTAGIA